jgi:iron complex transport system ATP-binding protein
MSAPGRPERDHRNAQREASPAGAPPRLACRALALTVPGRRLCDGLDIAVQAGECWVIVGPNGAGKTTLLSALAGLRAPDGGEVSYDGTALAALTPRERARRRGFLPQDSVDYFPATVLETVLVGRHPWLGRWQWEGAADVQQAQRALAEVGLAGFEARQVATLSGGERRRVALAALLAQDADLMLLDEPSSHLDLAHQIAALDAVARLARERGKAVVMVLHDLHLALRYADCAIAVGRGHAVAGPAAEILTAPTLSALFDHPLVALGEGRARTFVPA